MRSSARAICALGLALLAQARPLPVHAQTPERWLFVPVVAGDKTKSVDAAALSGELEAELRGTGQAVLPNGTAANQFDAQHSSEPPQLGNDELRRLSKSVSQAARHLALGELPEAQRSMESVNALGPAARDILNRENTRARRIFDNCLTIAYLYEREEQHQPALRQMLECSRNFPGSRPEGRAYPAEMRRLFEEATLQLSQSQSASLRVASAGRNGCTVRLNGLDVGRSQVQLAEVRVGTTRVQLECEAGSPGRVHHLELKPGDNELAVDPAFDSAVHSQGSLWLAYPNERERDKRAADDARVIGRALGATRVVTLYVSPGAIGQDVAVWPIGQGAGREVARAGYAAASGYAKGSASKVASALVGWLRAQPGAAAAARTEAEPKKRVVIDEAAERGREPEPASWAPPPSAAAARPPRRYTQQHAAAGAILAVIGGASMAVGWVVYAERQNKRRAVADNSEETTYRKLGVIALSTAALGTTLLSVSEYFWMPDEPDVPALAWVAGGLGAALGATAIALSFTESNCQLGDDRVSCQHFWGDHFFGPMLFMQALPLLTAPAWYGLRKAFRPKNVQITLNATIVGSPALNVRGVF
jgi:hypothetical protein